MKKLFLLAAIAACSSPNGPAVVAPRVDIVAGSNQTDTISTTNVQALVVRVIGTDGAPARGVVVNFDALDGPCRANPQTMCATMLVAPPEATAPFSTVASVTTGLDGTALVRTRMGMVAGAGGVTITVPLHGLTTVANFTIQPGAAVGFGVAPRDTTLFSGSEFTVRSASSVDRAGNPIPGAVTYESASPSVTVDATGRVRAVAPGVAFVRLRMSGQVVDSIRVSVWTAIPQTRIAISNINGPIRLATLTGGPERVLIAGVVNAQDWSPDGSRLVYVDDRGNGEYALSVTDTVGNTVQLPVPLRSTWPQYAHDGQWIYFFTQNNQPPRVFRIRPNGTSLENLMGGRFPSPSPDGVRIAVSLDNGIWVGNPVTQAGGVIPNTSFGAPVRWSPSGEWIAYRANSTIVVIRLDGTAKRIIPSSAVGGIAWSADSRYLLSGGGVRLELIDLQNGNAVMPIPVTGVYPAWKPVP